MSATLAAIGGAAALGSAIYGAVSSSIANNKARKLIQQQRDDNKSWRDINMARDYTLRSDVQAAIKRQRELLNEQYDRAKAAKVVAGDTEESLALQRQAANKSLSDTMTDVASQASAYKDAVDRQYRAQDAALNQQQAANYQQQAAATAAAAGQAVNAGVGLMGNALAGGIPTAANQAAASQAAVKAANVAATNQHPNNPLSQPVNTDFTPKVIDPAQPINAPYVRTTPDGKKYYV